MTMKTKKIADGHYAVVGTLLDIVRGDPPKYRNPQEWWVIKRDTDNDVLLAYSKGEALFKIEEVLIACGAAVPGGK